MNFTTHTNSFESVVLMNFPNNQCQNHICVVKINTDHGYHLNVTLDKFTTSGIVDPGCKYPGIVSGKEWNNSFRESVALCKYERNYRCEMHSKDSVFYRPSLFSWNSSLFLIFYSYKEYVKANVSLIIKSFLCKPVSINSMEINCMFGIEKCNTYLRKVTRESGVQLTTVLSDINTPAAHTIKVALTTTRCATIVIKTTVKYPELQIILSDYDVFNVKEDGGIVYYGDFCNLNILGQCTKYKEYVSKSIVKNKSLKNIKLIIFY